MANLVFYYLGDDEAYYKTLQGEFKRHSRTPIEFKQFYEKDQKKIQSFFLKIFKLKPACVFIDFSKETQEYLHLARVLVRTPMDHSVLTVGLIDFLSPPEVLKEGISTGVNLTHIKSSESFDVVFDVLKLLAPNDLGEHGFANAQLKEELEVGVPVKIGYIHNEGLHFETELKLAKGERVQINHHWQQKKMVPSKVLFINMISTSNLFYHYKYAVDADFLFVDEIIPVEGMDPKLLNERKSEREDYIIYHKKQLSHWIEDNQSRSLEKKAKVLVIDRQFHFYDDQPRTDQHPYTIRCIPFVQDIGIELDRMWPQVIAFALDREDVADKKNTIEVFEKMVEAIKAKFSDESPFFLLFNTKTPSKVLQDKLEYTHIMGIDGDLSVDLLIRMADIFDKKMQEMMAKVQPKTGSKPQKKVFIKKNNPASVSEIMIPVTLIKLSETDLTFQTTRELPIGANLHFTSPVDMYVHVLPAKNQNSKVPEYYGLIHSIGEVEKTQLRKFVNSVFFRDHDAQVNAEIEEFKKLNVAKLEEKEAVIKQAEDAEGVKSEEKEGSDKGQTPDQN